MYRKTIKLVSFFLLTVFTIQAQTNRAVVATELNAVQGRWQSEAIEIPLEDVQPFLAFSMVWEQEPGTPEVRFSADGIQWSTWEALPMDGHADLKPGNWSSQLYLAEKESRFVQIRSATNMGQVQAHFYNPGKSEKAVTDSDTPHQITTRDPLYCPCPQPDYEGRLDWCPDGSCPEDATPQFTTATHLIVHHSAGTNSSNDWAAVVRSIWDLHVFVRGWDDIGYNWLVDPNGVIYEGRGDGRLGAHFCGMNSATMGVCVMGDFTNITPTDEAVGALTELLSWKSCDIGADPLGSSIHSGSNEVLDHISGHRDGCSTSCPGDAFYPMLPGVRDEVVDYIAIECAPIGAPAELVAVASSETAITLDWVDITDNETGFQIERSNAFNGDYTLIATTAADTETYEDTGLTPETGYYYRVRSFNDQDTSIYSNKAFAATVIVGTEDVSYMSHVNVYPNPVADRVFIEWKQPIGSTSDEMEIKLRDYTGKLLSDFAVPGNQLIKEVSLKQLPGGIYWVEVSSSLGKRMFKLVKS